MLVEPDKFTYTIPSGHTLLCSHKFWHLKSLGIHNKSR